MTGAVTAAYVENVAQAAAQALGAGIPLALLLQRIGEVAESMAEQRLPAEQAHALAQQVLREAYPAAAEVAAEAKRPVPPPPGRPNLCRCAHAQERHTEQGEGACLTSGCGCLLFRKPGTGSHR